MYNTIKKIVKETMDGTNGRILIGTISSTEPFLVSVEQRLQLPLSVLTFPEHLQEIKLNVNIDKDEEIIREYIIRPKLAVGDKLIIINLEDEYVIFDKVGDYGESIIITQE